MTIFWGKKFFNSLKIGPNLFLQYFKNKIILNFVLKFIRYLQKKVLQLTTNFFFTLSFVAVFGSGIRLQARGHEKLLETGTKFPAM